jgi:hypothetical protein
MLYANEQAFPRMQSSFRQYWSFVGFFMPYTLKFCSSCLVCPNLQSSPRVQYRRH